METLDAEIRRFCHAHGLRLNTDLGQHFLIDQSVLDAIVEAAAITPEDHIVEIGPGIGILTRELLKRAQHVTAIELDRRLIPLIEDFITSGQKPVNQLTIVEGNALRVPMPRDHYKVVANIPYHITSPLLRHVFLESAAPPETMTLLIQREVAEKICPPERTRSVRAGDTENAGMLTILVGLFGTPRIIAKVRPEAFLPPPKVDSAVLHIACFPEPRAGKDVIDRIFTLTKIAFGQKRKMLSNTIGKTPGGSEALARAGIDPTRRPQTLSIDEWIRLAKESENAVDS
jgi:16S rRNA (adenine1518-N6/adenine1519-N6)-dimethyltransferase